MMAKEDLLKALDKAVRTEEKATPLYLRHVSASVPWFGFEDDEKEEIQNVLRSIAQDSSRHREMIEELREKVEQEDRDVF
ncbi:MAG: hypothetical protein KGZ25_01210 [Planctomycetes bacterium]|nr:hypothetical protein [Planctomycetota bacterium]